MFPTSTQSARPACLPEMFHAQKEKDDKKQLGEQVPAHKQLNIKKQADQDGIQQKQHPDRREMERIIKSDKDE